MRYIPIFKKDNVHQLILEWLDITKLGIDKIELSGDTIRIYHSNERIWGFDLRKYVKDN